MITIGNDSFSLATRAQLSALGRDDYTADGVRRIDLERLNDELLYQHHLLEMRLPRQTFKSRHFDAPNIVGHMMTSVNKLDGKPVYTIDQIQSDWGQRIETDTRNALAQRLFGKRFKELTADKRKQVSAAKQEGDKPAGVRDEAKIAELRQGIAAQMKNYDDALAQASKLAGVS